MILIVYLMSFRAKLTLFLGAKRKETGEPGLLEFNYSRLNLFTGYMPVNHVGVLAQTAVDVGITDHLLSQDEHT